MRQGIKMLSVSLFFTVLGWTQDLERAPAELIKYPDMIVRNGKIITVDDHSFGSNLGTIAEAMAIRDGQVLAVGSNEKILRLSGPKTQVLDLKGRTVLPGLISTHDHPHNWIWWHEPLYKGVISDDVVVTRFVRGTPETQRKQFEPTVKQAIEKAAPGQWIHISLINEGESELEGFTAGFVRERSTRALLDRFAPQNPIVVKGAHSVLVNHKALEEFKRVYPQIPEHVFGRQVSEFLEKGVGGTSFHRLMFADVMLAGKLDLLAELYKKEMAWWAGYGITTFSSHTLGTAQGLAAFALLDRRGEMPIRYAWSYNGAAHNDQAFLNLLASLEGQGSNYLWNVGAHFVLGSNCSSAPASAEVKAREGGCTLAPGTPGYDGTYRLIKAGVRIAGMHTGGDKDIDHYLEIIEKASADAGFSLEEIRAKRHSFDHCQMAPRPDQIPKISQLGMTVSCNTSYLWDRAALMVRSYGKGVATWIAPVNSLNLAKVMHTFETDRPLFDREYTSPFFYLEYGVTRRGPGGMLYGAKEAVSRVTMLKAATIQGAHYILRENGLGSLEPGKFADFIVLDRDYLNVPEDELHKINVLMTVIGGKIVHLAGSLSGELKMKPMGLQADTILPR